MSAIVLQGMLSAAVANDGTFTVSYPPRIAPETGVHDEGDFFGGVLHRLVIQNRELTSPNGFTLTFGTANITVTNKSGSTWAAGSPWFLQLESPGKAVYRDGVTGARVNRMGRSDTFLINLGAPDVADVDGICASQAVNSGVAALLNGAIGATLDAPRNVVAAWTNTAVITVTGRDEYGNVVVEQSASGTSLTGKKAFKTITSVTFNANVTGATVGTGDVLGLPVFLPGTGHVIRELQDGGAPTAGTTVAGVLNAGGATATTGDVRGTYDPNAACDGDRVFQLIVALADPGYLGQPQFAG